MVAWMANPVVSIQAFLTLLGVFPNNEWCAVDRIPGIDHKHMG